MKRLDETIISGKIEATFKLLVYMNFMKFLDFLLNFT